VDDLAGGRRAHCPSGAIRPDGSVPGPDAGNFRLTGLLLVAFGNPRDLLASLGD